MDSMPRRHVTALGLETPQFAGKELQKKHAAGIVAQQLIGRGGYVGQPDG
jgi:hypothetical protein